MPKSLILLFPILFLWSCQAPNDQIKEETPSSKLNVILDTDANNELDDQHALAYLFFNQSVFNTIGITVNATYNGGDIEGHYKEADRIMHLCNVQGDFPLLMGANGNFLQIRDSLNTKGYDGSDAVEFIINEAKKATEENLILVPVGKLTNIALAIHIAPEIKENIEIVWLGANYPAPGEYNLDNDTSALNYLLEQDVKFDLVMVRYGEESGSDAVRVTPDDITSQMTDAGPEVEPIEGRHGGSFTNFGSYSYNLFSKIDLHGDPPSRSLFDVVALAVLKNKDWGAYKEIPAPFYGINGWEERPSNARMIGIWENFDKNAILKDFFFTMNNPN